MTMGTATAIRMLLLRLALACAFLFCTRHALSATLTSTPPFNDTPLQLTVSENSCNPYEAQEYFDLANASSASVVLSHLSIKYWIYDTSGQTIGANAWYGGCVVDGSGRCVHPVSGVSISVQPATGCSAADKVNWEITVTTTDSYAMPPGYSWNNVQTAINPGNYTPFSPGTSSWFSSCGNGQPYTENATFAVYMDNSLVYSPDFGITAPNCRAPHGLQSLTGYVRYSTGVPMIQHVPPALSVRLAIGFPIQQNNGAPDILTFVNQVSDPKSAFYRQYLSAEDFSNNYGLLPGDLSSATTFATSHNLEIVETSANHLVVFVVGTARDVEQAFYCTLNVYQRADGTIYLAPDREPSVDLGVTVGYVSGLDDHFVTKPAYQGSGDALFPPTAPTSQGLGPLDLRGAYASCKEGILDGTGQRVALVEFDGYNGCDISTIDPYCSQGSVFPDPGYNNGGGYLDQFKLLPTSAYTAFNNNGPTDPSAWPVRRVLLDEVLGDIQGPGPNGGQGEVELDIDMVEAMAPGAIVTAFESHWGARSVNTFLENGFGANLDYYQVHILNAIATTTPLNMQISTSWSLFADSNTIGVILEFAAQGQSFYDASGDLNKGQWLDGINTLPFVTAVGGTELVVNNFVYVGEGAWAGSAGGVAAPVPGQPAFCGAPLGFCFSAPLAAPLSALDGPSVPSFQELVGGQVNLLGRNVPDVAMAANGIIVPINGTLLNANGTSAAAPLWAGFTALINQEASHNNVLSLGQPNPVLYALASPTTQAGTQLANPLYAQLFNDITLGQQAFDGLSYAAAPGYDLVTGLGSPTCTLIDQLASINPLAPTRKLRIVANTTLAADDPATPTGFQNLDNGTETLGSEYSLPQGLFVPSFGVEDFVTITESGGLGGVTDSSAPTIDLTCDPGAAGSATVYYSYCVSRPTNSNFFFSAVPDYGDGSSPSDPAEPVGSADQFTMIATCGHADAIGLMHVHATFQLWNGCGSGRIPTGRSDFSVESGGGCGILGFGQCFNNTSRRELDFDVGQGIGVGTDPDVCFENKTHFNNANGCDDNHVQASGLQIPGGVAFINTAR
jgi:kumamolisin